MKKKGKGMTKERLFCLLLVVAVLHLIFVMWEFPFLFRLADSSLSSPSRRIHQVLEGKVEINEKKPVIRPAFLEISSLSFNLSQSNGDLPFSKLHEKAFSAWEKGGALLRDLQSGNLAKSPEKSFPDEACPRSISLSSTDFKKRGGLMILPCGLTFGSVITVVAKPTKYIVDGDPQMEMMLSQFMMELQGLKVVEGEDPPRILHFNPRLKGDWSHEPVLEMNTCYRMQWGTPLRCDGRRSDEKEDTVDGKVKCEEWKREEDERLDNSKSTRWFSGLAGQTKESTELTYPFVEGKLFTLALSAGSEGYHMHVNGRHISSFAYRTGFALEDATGLALTGDIEVQSVLAEALPASHLSFSLQNRLEMSSQWKSPSLTKKPVDLFVGVLSSGNHFAERMAVRKSWMQSTRGSQSVVARFFVGMHARDEINFQLKKEAEFFGDVVIVPFMDSYDLVVLKTLAICEYGIKRVPAKYILKCDDDTFVRIDSVLEDARKVSADHSLYLGNINYFHNPQRDGKWAVTYEEWPEEVYPPYANGPGYVITSDIAQFIISEFENHRLRLFKMEDVSVGMWVEQFNRSRAVEYVHSLRYCQFGCVDDYLTAHYQSPRQMICLWDKLQAGNPQCCDS